MDEQRQKINECITEEGTAIKQMQSALKYTDDTLSPSDGAPLMKELQSNLQSETIQSKENAPELPAFLVPAFEDVKSGRGTISTNIYASPMVHSRVQAMDFSELFQKANMIKTIDIDMKREAKGYRIANGFNKVLVCFWDITSILLYSDDGNFITDFSMKDAGRSFSATFLDRERICCCGDNGIFIRNLQTQTTEQISEGKYSDVFYFNTTLYALRYDTGTIWIAQHKDGNWKTNSRSIEIGLGTLNSSSTFVATSSSIYVCDCKVNVFEFSLDGIKLNTLDVGLSFPTIAAVNETGDVLLTSLQGNINQVHIASTNKQPSTCTVPGLTSFQDVVFQDHKRFWVLDCVSIAKGTYRLIKYVID